MDSPYQVLERINNIASKIDLPGKLSVHCTFNGADLSRDDFPNLRMNPFEERKMIRIMVFYKFQEDLLHNPKSRRFNKRPFFIYKIE